MCKNRMLLYLIGGSQLLGTIHFDIKGVKIWRGGGGRITILGKINWSGQTHPEIIIICQTKVGQIWYFMSGYVACHGEIQASYIALLLVYQWLYICSSDTCFYCNTRISCAHIKHISVNCRIFMYVISLKHYIWM